MKLLDKESVDIIVTSPPYNIGKNYNEYNDKKTENEYMELMNEVAKESSRVLKEEGSFFLNIGGRLNNPWLPMDVANVFRQYYSLQNLIHWIKSISISKDNLGSHELIKRDIIVGHYQPINSSRFLSNFHEFIFHFTKNSKVELDKLAIGVPYKRKSNVNRWKSIGKDLRERGNVWFISYKTIQKSRNHPAIFPKKLPEMCIKLHGKLNTETVVLDPFMGIGTTAIICRNLGINFIGFEIDKLYVDMANRELLKPYKPYSPTEDWF